MSDALARVDAAEASGTPVQRRVCETCGATQGRIQGKDGVFRRWSKCQCPKSGGGPSEPQALPSGTRRNLDSPPVDVGVHDASRLHSSRVASSGSTNSEEAPDPFEPGSPWVPSYPGVVEIDPGPCETVRADLPLHRDQVTRLSKRKGE
jgi:hypothetical protein